MITSSYWHDSQLSFLAEAANFHHFTHADVSHGCTVLVTTVVCLSSLFLHTISKKTDAATITKLDIQIFYDESWKPTYSGVKRSRSRVIKNSDVLGLYILVSAGCFEVYLAFFLHVQAVPQNHCSKQKALTPTSPFFIHHQTLLLLFMAAPLRQYHVLVTTMQYANWWQITVRTFTSNRVPTIFWYWNSRTFQGPSNFIFKDQLSTKVYSMSSRTAIFNVYLCDDGTVIR